jgi:hypothetical protein
MGDFGQILYFNNNNIFTDITQGAIDLLAASEQAKRQRLGDSSRPKRRKSIPTVKLFHTLDTWLAGIGSLFGNIVIGEQHNDKIELEQVILSDSCPTQHLVLTASNRQPDRLPESNIDKISKLIQLSSYYNNIFYVTKPQYDSLRSYESHESVRNHIRGAKALMDFAQDATKMRAQPQIQERIKARARTRTQSSAQDAMETQSSAQDARETQSSGQDNMQTQSSGQDDMQIQSSAQSSAQAPPENQSMSDEKEGGGSGRLKNKTLKKHHKNKSNKRRPRRKHTSRFYIKKKTKKRR